MKTFKIINSDQRFTFLKNLLCNEESNASFIENLNDIKSNNLILPIPITRDGVNILNTNFNIKNFFSKVDSSTNVFCGKKSLLNGLISKNIKLFDYSDNEMFLLNNAKITAYGILNIILKNTNKPFYSLKFLVSGFGRIGKILSNLLLNLKSNVYVLGHSQKDEFWINYNNLKKFDLEQELDFDFIINTAPDMIFSDRKIKKANKNTIFIETASIPGIDKESCYKYNLKYILSLGIPGKYFPEESAKIIKNSIFNILNSGEK